MLRRFTFFEEGLGGRPDCADCFRGEVALLLDERGDLGEDARARKKTICGPLTMVCFAHSHIPNGFRSSFQFLV